MGLRHIVVFPQPDGSERIYPLKEWFRANQAELAPGVDIKDWTSHQMRAVLIRKHWFHGETPTEYRLMPPDTTSAAILAAEVAAEDPEDIADAGHYFGYERELRDFLALNLPQIEVIPGKRLKVYVDPTQADGVEYQTGVGRIDILAVDDVGDFYVFELKRADSSDDVFGQVSRYMGWVRYTIGREKNVSGVIVARQITEKLRYAAYGRDDVHLFEYEVSFKVKPAREIS